MQRAFNQPVGAAVILAAALCSMTQPLAGQRLLDLPVRTWAGADAIATGAVAAFWNPAGTGVLARRAEILIVDVLAPEPTGIGGFAAAGAWRIDESTTLAAGYHHVGIDNVLRTGDSPLPGDATPLDLGEDGLAIAASRRVDDVFHGGLVVRYIRASRIVEDRGVVEFGAGVQARPRLRTNPVIAAFARAEADGFAWSAGAGAMPFGDAERGWRAGATWGIEDSPRHPGPAHRLAAVAGWRDYVEASVGVANEPDAEERTWRPVVSGALRLSRYALGVMRENMANGFGALHTVRFSVVF